MLLICGISNTLKSFIALNIFKSFDIPVTFLSILGFKYLFNDSMETVDITDHAGLYHLHSGGLGSQI